jgi:hypothetical protein
VSLRGDHKVSSFVRMTAASEVFGDPEELRHRHQEDYSEARLASCTQAEASCRQIQNQFKRRSKAGLSATRFTCRCVCARMNKEARLGAYRQTQLPGEGRTATRPSNATSSACRRVCVLTNREARCERIVVRLSRRARAISSKLWPRANSTASWVSAAVSRTNTGALRASAPDERRDRAE